MSEHSHRFLEAQRLGKLLYTFEDVARVMQLDEEECLQLRFDKQSDLYKGYWAGHYATDIDLRESIRKLAMAGSSPAQTLMIKLMQETQTKNYYHGTDDY